MARVISDKVLNKEILSSFLTTFFGKLTHLILFERSIYEDSLFNHHIYYNIPLPLCTHTKIVDYINESGLIANKFINEQRLKAYAVCVKNQTGVVEKFIFFITELTPVPGNKEDISYDCFSFVETCVQKIRSNLLRLSPSDEICDQTSFSIEFLTTDNTFHHLPDNLEVVFNEFDEVKKWSIVPLASVNSKLFKMEIYAEISKKL